MVADQGAASGELPPQRELREPIIRALRALGGSGTNEAIEQEVVRDLRLSESLVRKLHDQGKGGRTELQYRLAWARTRLKQAGLIESAGTRRWALTPQGTKTPES